MRAVRNIRLCTKDCLCLYVCPTGATDTETGQIDADKCIGCGVCAGACPSHAIAMVPEQYPPQQPKSDAVRDALFSIARRKVRQENIARQIAAATDDPIVRQLAEAFAKSNRLIAEDILREAGYMLPQSGNAHALLAALLDAPQDADFPAATVRQLLGALPDNDAQGK